MKRLILISCVTLCTSVLTYTELARGVLAQGSGEARFASVRALVQTETPTGSSVAQFFRDAQGRSRLEEGSVVVINDPVDGLSFVLNNETKTGRRSATRKTGEMARYSSEEDQSSRPLGNRLHEGYDLAGIEQKITARVPDSSGQWHDVDRTMQLWFSKELSLVVLFSSWDRLYGEITKRYINIEKDVSLDAGLFRPPAGYKIQ